MRRSQAGSLGYTLVGYTLVGYTLVGYTLVGYTLVGYTLVGYTLVGYTLVGCTRVRWVRGWRGPRVRVPRAGPLTPQVVGHGVRRFVMALAGQPETMKIPGKPAVRAQHDGEQKRSAFGRNGGMRLSRPTHGTQRNLQGGRRWRAWSGGGRFRSRVRRSVRRLP